MRQFHPFHSQLYLGKGRALYSGPLQHLEAHVYGAPALHVGIYGPFRMMLGDATWRSYCAAIVPPGLRHALDVAGGVHGKLFVETDSPSASAFRCRFPYRRGAVTDLRPRGSRNLPLGLRGRPAAGRGRAPLGSPACARA
jgi:hypothetical protein